MLYTHLEIVSAIIIPVEFVHDYLGKKFIYVRRMTDASESGLGDRHWITFSDDINSTFNNPSEYQYLACSFRIVSWNLLGDSPSLSLSPKHDYCPMEFRVWHDPAEKSHIASRLDRTAAKLLELNTDIFCLQECLPSMFEDLKSHPIIKGRFTCFHMKDYLVHTLDDLIMNDHDITELKVRSTSKSSRDFDCAVFLSHSFMNQFKLCSVKSGTFKEFAPKVPSSAASKISGKARKRLLTLDSDGFLMLRLVSNACKDVEITLVCTHLYWNPNEPHVKALQAELLSHLAHIFSGGQKLPDLSANASLEMNKQLDVTKNHNARPSTLHPKSRFILIGGDLNSVPNFQPQFLATDEERHMLCASYQENGVQIDEPKHSTVKIDIAKLPLHKQQSAVFRLLLNGMLESDHPEHPDKFGRITSIKVPSKRIKVCGPLYCSPFVDNKVITYKMTHAFPRHLFEDASNTTHAEESFKFWPEYTNKVSDFEGTLDYILWCDSIKETKFCEGGECFIEKDMSAKIIQVGVLDIPSVGKAIPDHENTSDHLPVGAVFRIWRKTT